MKRNPSKSTLFESVTYNSFTLILIMLVFYFSYFKPATYTLMIAEDNWGEYTTAFCFAFASLVIIIYGLRQDSCFQKGLFFLIGLTALFIAGEEISWGQRIFQFSTPTLFDQINYQREFTIHNLEVINKISLQAIISYFILVWLFYSIIKKTFSLSVPVKRIHLPLIPTHLFSIFLSVPYFFLWNPVPKSDEIGELFFGIALLLWGCQLFSRPDKPNSFQVISKLPVISGMLILITSVSMTLSHHNVGHTTFWLNVMAVRDYPERGMHKQAQQLFEYICANPKYLMSDTRLNYGRLLMETGQKDQAIRILLHDDKEFKGLNETDPHFSKKMRQLGIRSLLLEKEEQADEQFNHAIKADQQRLESKSTGDERARILWSIAMTLKARGEPKAAIKTAREAGENASSSSLRWHIDRWEKSVAR